MKNKIISLVLVGSLVSQVLAAPIENSFKSTTTEGTNWTDPSSGMNYESFGKKTFSLKKRTTKFAPWFKGNPPSLNAGCNGVSLDGGFVAFLNQDEIEAQLETAMQSVGMGVVVVLLQTLPSIGKAFEDIQKLVRKIQSMLQNACQLTKKALEGKEGAKESKKKSDAWLNDADGESYLTAPFKGSADYLDNLETAVTCEDGDFDCRKAKAALLFQQINDESVSEKNTYEDRCVGADSTLCNSVIKARGDEHLIKIATLKDVIVDNKFDSKDLLLSETDITFMKLKYALFGILAVDEKVSLTQLADENGEIEAANILKKIAGGEVIPPISYNTEWMPPLNDIADVKEFLTTGGAQNVLTLPGNVNIVGYGYCPEAKKNGGCASKTVHYTYFEKTSMIMAPIEVEWGGLLNNSFLTIMNLVDKRNPAPAVPTGFYLPNGDRYLKTVRDLAQGGKPWEVKKYAGILASANVYFALQGLITSVEGDILGMEANGADKTMVNQYQSNAKKITDAIKEYLEKTPNDIKKTIEFEKFFENQLNYNKTQDIGRVK